MYVSQKFHYRPNIMKFHDLFPSQNFNLQDLSRLDTLTELLYVCLSRVIVIGRLELISARFVEAG